MADTQNFRFGEVLSQTLKMPLTEIKIFLPLMLVTLIVPLVLIIILLGHNMQYLIANIKNLNLNAFRQVFLPLGLGVIVSLLAYSVYSIFTIKHSINRMVGENVSFGSVFKQSIFLIPVMFLLYILMSIGTMLGTLLLIIPGVFLALSWYTAPAVMAHEGGGPINALKRAFYLSSDARLKTLGFIIVLYVVFLVTSLISGAIQPFFINENNVLTSGGELNTVNIALYYLVTFPLTYYNYCIFSVGVATLYVELRRVKEGFGGETLAQTFD
jgi:hypothetical protein